MGGSCTSFSGNEGDPLYPPIGQTPTFPPDIDLQRPIFGTIPEKIPPYGARNSLRPEPPTDFLVTSAEKVYRKIQSGAKIASDAPLPPGSDPSDVGPCGGPLHDLHSVSLAMQISRAVPHAIPGPATAIVLM
jgi:hypothetical protein